MPDSLPLAQHVLNFAGPHEIHNRVRKAVVIAFDIFWHLGDKLTYAKIESLTSAEMTQAARNIGERPPNSAATENAVRELLRAMLKIRDANGMRPADAAATGLDGLMALLSPGATVMVVQVPAKD